MAGEGFKALADPTRRRILELLRDGDIKSFRIGNTHKVLRKSVMDYIYKNNQ